MKHKGNYRLMCVGTIIMMVLMGIGQQSHATIKTNSCSILGKDYTTQPDDVERLYDLLIIAPSYFHRELQRLVLHKESMGVSTLLFSMSDVYTLMEQQGRDEAEKLKYFIFSAHEQWGIRYVLLIGGKMNQGSQWHVPVRYVQMDNNWESQFISDLYFADLYDKNGAFSSWDTDQDGLYGEWYADQRPEDTELDLFPDVAVGRLPCRNAREVHIMVEKIITYETSVYDQPWFYDMLVFAGDTMPKLPQQPGILSSDYDNPQYEGEYYGELAIDNMSNFRAHRYYTSDGALNLWFVIDAFNKGAGFVYFVGHGSPQMWGTYLPNGMGYAIGLFVQYVSKLDNGERLPICVISGCHCCQFDVSLYKLFNKIARKHMEGTRECLGWRITNEKNGGSIATIGNTALGYIKEDKTSYKGGGNELEVEFFRQYGQQGIDILGDTWAAAISWYLDTYPVQWNSTGISDSWIDAQVVESWVLLGDPSLKIGGYKLPAITQ
jgi:hypothetical protein